MSRISRLALARVTVHPVRADAAVLARVRTAFVDVDLATFTSVTGSAVAYELVETVFAAQRVQGTRVAGTLVNVGQAPGPVVTAGTFTPPTGHQVHATAAVGARVAGAFVHVHFAVQTGKSGEAIARIPKTKTKPKNEINVCAKENGCSMLARTAVVVRSTVPKSSHTKAE